MAPEPTIHRSQRHRSQSRPRQRSPSREPSRRRPHRDASPLCSPTRKRSDPESRSRDRHRKDTHWRAKSRPPGPGDGCRDIKSIIKRPRVRFSMIDAEGSATALTTKATHSGFMRKQADNEPGAWNKYYFVIKPLTYLVYYNSMDDEKPRGIIDLEYLTDVKRNADCLQRAVGGGDSCFRVSGKLPRPTAEHIATGDVSKMRPLYLDPENTTEAEKWMEAIRTHRFSLKKDEEFVEMAQQVQHAKLRVVWLEEIQRKEADVQKNLCVKAKTLLQKMRAIGSGHTDEDLELNADDLDDTADNMLAVLEGMEDVMITLSGKIEQYKQGSVESLKYRRQRALSNAKCVDLPAEEEEKKLAAIRNRRKGKIQQAVSQEKHIDIVQKTPREKLKVAPKDEPREKHKVEMEKAPSEVPALDNVSDVLAMWKAQKKKDAFPKQQIVFEQVDKDNFTRRRTKSRSERGPTTSPETIVNSQHKSFQKRRGSDRASEEDTVSLDSCDDCIPGEKLPPGWTKHESRGYPGTYYFAHESGKVSWDVPTDDMVDSEQISDDCHSDHGEQNAKDDKVVTDEYEDTQHCEEAEILPDTIKSAETSPEYFSEYETEAATAGATTSAAYRKNKPKPKSTWAFKLPKLLPTTTTQTLPTEPVVVQSPIRRGFNHHEF